MNDWIFFGIGVVLVGVVGIAIGLVAGRAIASRAARREGGGEDAFMTPVGAPADDAAAASPADVAGAPHATAPAGAAADDAGRAPGSDRDA